MSGIIDQIMAPAWLIFGLSHAALPKSWADLFESMARTRFAGLIIGSYTLPMGLFLIVCHNVWVWDWPVIITLSGWGMTAKSVVYLLVPRSADQVLNRAVPRHHGFRIVGLIMAAVGVALTWDVYGI